jgi:hypothetical protein
MPFDGKYFEDQTAHDKGLFPIWAKRGWRCWIRVGFVSGAATTTQVPPSVLPLRWIVTRRSFVYYKMPRC